MGIDFEIIESAPLTPLEKIYDERVIDWVEDGMNINHQMQIHREKYRAKICSKCSDKQRETRECVIVDGVSDKRDCSHMDKAVYAKFNKQNIIHLNSHPRNFRKTHASKKKQA